MSTTSADLVWTFAMDPRAVRTAEQQDERNAASLKVRLSTGIEILPQNRRNAAHEVKVELSEKNKHGTALIGPEKSPVMKSSAEVGLKCDVELTLAWGGRGPREVSVAGSFFLPLKAKKVDVVVIQWADVRRVAFITVTSDGESFRTLLT